MTRRLGILIGMLVLGLAGSGSALAQPATPATDAEPAWLVIQAFDGATLTPGATAGDYTLTLTDVHALALAFTDRPNRQVAQVATADFAHAVSDAQADPLNATLVAPALEGAGALVVVELLDVAYDADAGTVSYQVTVLAAEEESLTGDVATPLPDLDTELTFGPGHLFVDEVQVPAREPVNVCGNVDNPVGLLTPATGNTCVDD